MKQITLLSICYLVASIVVTGCISSRSDANNYYTVKTGEDIYSVALKFDVECSKLKKLTLASHGG